MTLTKLFHRLVILVTVVVASGCVLPAQEPSVNPSGNSATASPSPVTEAQLSAEIDALMTGLVKQGQFSGALLVAKEGRVMISKGYGLADQALAVPNTPQTKFRLGSITKQFTALAILKLQQQGELNVQDPICRYIQACPKAWQPITIHQLLTHTSGIHNFTALPNYAEFKKQPATPLELIDQFRDLPLDFTPGNRWSYSNSGYIVLGYMIEEISGQSYANFLQANIFEPLQMENTGYDDNRKIIAPRATGYSHPAVTADYIDMSIPYAAGGLYSTVEDLFLWDQALYTGILMPLTLQNEMFTPFASIPVDRAKSSDVSYGYGWRIGKQFDRLWVAHGGGVEGFATKFDRYPDDQIAIIVLSNLESAPVGNIALDIAQILFEAK